MCSSILIAECIYRSDWGTKDLAKKENNLFLLSADEYYKGKTVELAGVSYKIYDNWLEFFVDLGDYYVFTKRFDKVLKAINVDQQIDFLSELPDYSKAYCGMLEKLIIDYGLWEFDRYY